jgi:hypothetical protein
MTLAVRTLALRTLGRTLVRMTGLEDLVSERGERIVGFIGALGPGG